MSTKTPHRPTSLAGQWPAWQAQARPGRRAAAGRDPAPALAGHPRHRRTQDILTLPSLLVQDVGAREAHRHLGTAAQAHPPLGRTPLLAAPALRRTATASLSLFETAARAGEVLALNITDLDLEARPAPIRSKGGDTEWIYWGSGTGLVLQP
jgi:integrase